MAHQLGFGLAWPFSDWPIIASVVEPLMLYFFTLVTIKSSLTLINMFYHGPAVSISTVLYGYRLLTGNRHWFPKSSDIEKTLGHQLGIALMISVAVRTRLTQFYFHQRPW